MKKYGLIGYPLGHSFSKKYYQEKIDREAITGVDYDLYPLERISELTKLISTEASFAGFNVTIPYKQQVIPLLDAISEEARSIGAVNCITLTYETDDAKPILTGYNTDVIGFRNSLTTKLNTDIHRKALVLGNGGAAKAVCFALNELNIPYLLVSRRADIDSITYKQLTEQLVKEHQLIVNCTPLGTAPNVDECPDIPYAAITKDHYLYDLIYNPEETLFLQKGKEMGAITKNGWDMLIIQAEENWKLWNP